MLTGTTNEQKIWNFLTAAGFTACGASGLMGNLYAESGLSPTNLQNTYEKSLGLTDAAYTAAVDSGAYGNFVQDKAGYGLAQWTYWSRKQGLLEYAKSKRVSIGDLEMQLEYLLKELTSYGLLASLKSATSVREASNLVLLKFEKPASMNTQATQDRRAGYAQGYYDKYAGAAKAPATGGITLKLVQAILTNNPCYKTGKKITPKGLMLHSVGCSQPTATVFVNNWNKASYDRACVHGFIDANDGTVYQTLPWNHRGWHSAGAANNTHIGVEMCEPACIKYTGGSSFTCSDLEKARAAAKRTYDSAVALFAMLCKQYNLNPLADGVVISHKEGHSRGIASNHGDPEHLWKGLGMSYTMDGFRKDVKAAMGNVAVTSSSPAPAPAASSTTQNAVTPYTVKITANTLNIRKGPGTNYGTNGAIKDKGVYTITAESAGEGATKWGKLKSGAGWISLDYCSRV